MKQPTEAEMLKLVKQKLHEDYLRLRKQVKDQGIKSLNKGEREFFLTYPS